MAGQSLNSTLRQGYAGALGNYGNALQGFQQSYYKAPSSGLLGGLASMAGSYFGGLGGGGMGGGQAPYTPPFRDPNLPVYGPGY
jgi:hypothetical protein